MAAHWTYADASPTSELEQGDILRPTPELRAVFSQILPHFQHEKYIGFLVATQSCDLVRRGSRPPKALYINLAVIRPVSQVMSKLITYVAEPIASGAFRASRKAEARMLIERILNQNEQSIGLFFLFTDVDSGIAEPSVAFLRVTISLRAQHYETLLAARVGRLQSAFQAKLGWLMGNLFDRPATPDWSDTGTGKQDFERMVDQYVAGGKWIDDQIVDNAIKQGIALEGADEAVLASLRPPTRMDRVLEEIGSEMHKFEEIPLNVISQVQKRLRNSSKFGKILREKS